MPISFSVKNGNPNMALVMISSWIYNYLHVESVTITTKVVSSIPAQGEVYLIQYYNLCNEICQILAAGWWFFTGNPDSSTSKTDHHDITEILLKVVLNTVTPHFIIKCLCHRLTAVITISSFFLFHYLSLK